MTVIKNSIIVFVNWMLEGGEILSIDLSLEHVFWRQKAPGAAAWYSAKPYLFQDCLLFGTNRGDIAAFRVDDGVKVWTHRLEGEAIRVFGSSGNVLYVGTLKGNLYACQLTEP
jgi:outer membrane protein assembly factor BamB